MHYLTAAIFYMNRCEKQVAAGVHVYILQVACLLLGNAYLQVFTTFAHATKKKLILPVELIVWRHASLYNVIIRGADGEDVSW